MDYLTILDSITSEAKLLLSLILVLAITVTYLFFSSTAVAQNLPLYGAEYGIYPRRVFKYMRNAQSMYLDSYVKLRNKTFRITTADGEKVVVPLKYMEELRSKPEEQINNAKAHEQVFETKITGLNTETQFLNHLIRADLTKKLPQLIERLATETDRSFRAELPQGESWSTINVNERVSRIIAILSGSVLVGAPLCYDEDYLAAAMNYSKDISAAIRALKIWPRFMRPLVKHFTPQVGVIKRYRAKAKKMLQPLITKLRETMAKGDGLPDTMMAWMIEKADEFKADDDELAETQLIFIMAGIHTTTMTITHMLYDLAAYSDCVDDLRKEITTVLSENDGVLSSHALFQMKLLDSFMLESQRHNPIQMTRFQRFVQKPVTLQDGTQIPAGVIIEAPHVAITRDPAFYPEPDKFDPYRFQRLRQGESADPIGYINREQYQFVTVTKENMGFGYGRHACPGRFFAAAEIKLFLVRLLLDYEISMPSTETAGQRYANLSVANYSVADTKKEILIRRRSRG